MTTPRPVTPEQDFVRWRERADVHALGRVFDVLAPELLIVAAHVAGRSAAEDLVQAAFLQAITDGARWDATRPLLPWLVGILANLALREREKGRRVIDPARAPLPAGEADPHDEAERHEFAQALGSALQGMPRHYRQVLVMRLVHGLEPAAIAHALGAPPATVKSRLQRGLDLLRRALPQGLHVPAFAVWSAPSLESVRATVLVHANAHAAAAASVATTTGVAATTAAVGGVLLMKKTMIAVVGIALAATLAVSLDQLSGAPASGDQPKRPEAQPSRVETAAREPAPATPPPDTARTEVPSATAGGGAAAAAAPGITGRVVDESGKPLADVGVFLGDKRLDWFQNTNEFLVRSDADRATTEQQVRKEANAQVQRTGATGEFSLAEPPNPAPHLLVAWSPERGCRGIDLPADRTQPLEIVLPQDPVVRGVVRSRADRSPIAGAAVQVWPAKSGMPIAWRQGDEHGAYTLPPLPPGAYRTLVEADGFAKAQPGFDVAAGERTHELDVELEPLPRFAVLLVDHADQPWTAARIGEAIGAKPKRLEGVLSEHSYARRAEMQSASWLVHRVQVDPDGHVRGAVSDPKAVVLAIWHGPEKLFEVPAFDFAATRLAIEMLPRATIELQVRVRFDPPAATPPQLELAVVDPAGMGNDEQALVARTTNDAFCALPVPLHFAGRDCGLVVKAKGYVPSYTVVGVPAQAEGTWQEVTLSQPACTLRGVVVGPDGQPLPKASLLVADAEGRWLLPPRLARRWTGLDGTFTIADLPRRRVRLFAQADKFAPRAVEVDTGADEVHRIELQQAREVTWRSPAGVGGVQFRVLDTAGRPLVDDRLQGAMRYGAQLTVGAEAATIEVFDASTGAMIGSGLVPADGKLVLK
ncbi:MAG TPA: sigma-70 family RNA polymerase sigma factor [Planctomycetota bacterium]|nr:sigma-70 family RNA polymerase sigma factor [Planctomycetota bacterium]